MTENTGVSRQEAIVYGAMAQTLRKLGLAAAGIEQARDTAWEVVCKAQDDDKVSPSVPEEGSDYARWTGEVWERITELNNHASRLLQQLSSEAVNVEIRMRQSADQTDDQPHPSEVAFKDAPPSNQRPLTLDALVRSYEMTRRRGARFVKLVTSADLEQQTMNLLEADETPSMRALVSVETDTTWGAGEWAVVPASAPERDRQSEGRIVGE